MNQSELKETVSSVMSLLEQVKAQCKVGADARIVFLESSSNGLEAHWFFPVKNGFRSVKGQSVIRTGLPHEVTITSSEDGVQRIVPITHVYD